MTAEISDRDMQGCPVNLPGGWLISVLETWQIRLCQHPSGAMVVFMEDRAVVHRGEGTKGEQAATEVEALLRAASFALVAGGPDHPTVIYSRRAGPGE